MWPFNKSIDDLSEADLQAVVAAKIREGYTLDYKQAAYTHDNSGSREMLKDVISLANASGGHLILGVSEDRSAGVPDGVPDSMLGIAGGSNEQSWMETLCHQCIKPSIVGLRVRDIEIQGNLSAVVVFVPNSGNKPHLLEHRDKREFYTRQERQNLKMSVEQIHEAVLMTYNASQAHREFISSRRNQVLEFAGGHAALWVFVVPQFIGPEKLDVFDQDLIRFFEQPTQLPGMMNFPHQFALRRPDLDGLEALRTAQNPEYRSMMRIQRVGFADFAMCGDVVIPQSSAQDLLLNEVMIQEGAYWWSRFGCDFVTQFLSGEPVQLGIQLLNTKNSYIKPRSQYDAGDTLKLQTTDHLLIPELRISTKAEWQTAAKWQMDRMHNAFGYAASPDFDAEGRLLCGQPLSQGGTITRAHVAWE